MRPRDKIIAAAVKAVVNEAKFIAKTDPTIWWPDEAVRVMDLVRQGVFQEINLFQQDVLRKANEK